MMSVTPVGIETRYHPRYQLMAKAIEPRLGICGEGDMVWVIWDDAEGFTLIVERNPYPTIYKVDEFSSLDEATEFADSKARGHDKGRRQQEDSAATEDCRIDWQP